MKKIFSLLLTSFICISAFAQSGWTEVNAINQQQLSSEIPHERYSPASFSIGSDFYYGCGGSDLGFSFQERTDFFSFSSTSHKWSLLSPYLGQAKLSAVSFSDSLYGYVMLGNDDNNIFYSDNWKYDPVNDTWTQMSSFPSFLRENAFYFAADKKLILGCGRMGNSFLNDVWMYDPGLNSWTQKNNFSHTQVTGAKGFTINNIGYLCAGFDSTSTLIDSVYKYDILSDTWIPSGNFPGTNLDAAFATSAYGYVLSGNLFYQFNPANNNWTVKSPPPAAFPSAAIGINNFGYIVTINSTVYEYDEANDQWQTLMNNPFANSFAVNPSVVVGDTVHISEWKYNFVTDEWRRDASLSQTKWLWMIGNKAGILQSGTFRIYDFSTFTSTAADYLPVFPEVYFMADGRYFAGIGYDTTFQVDYHIYEYDTLNDQWIQRAAYPGQGSEYMFSFGIDTFGYAGGGLIGSNSGAYDFWKYDALADQWIQKAGLPTDMSSYGFSTTYNGRGYVGFGGDGYQGNYSCGIYDYDPALDAWNLLNSPLNCRLGAFAFVAGTSLYAGGGHFRHTMAYTDFFIDVWKYNDGTVSVPVIENNPVEAHFNSTENSIIISGLKKNDEINVIDLSGKLLIRKKADNDVMKINMSGFSNSTYTVRINDGVKKIALMR